MHIYNEEEKEKVGLNNEEAFLLIFILLGDNLYEYYSGISNLILNFC